MVVGDKIKVIERTSEGVFEWDGEVTQVNEVFYETVHQREKRPEWDKYLYAYNRTWIKHYKTPTSIKQIVW